MNALVRRRGAPIRHHWRPPAPREHGAWAMVYVPLAVGLALVPDAAGLAVALLVLAVTAGFFLQNAVLLALRKPASPARAWVLPLGVVFAASGLGVLGLASPAGAVGLAAVAVLATGFFALYGRLLLRPPRRRAHREVPVELLAVAVMGLSGPAALALSETFELPRAVGLWALTTVHFGGSVVAVRVAILVARAKGEPTAAQRARFGRPSTLWHAVGLAGVVVWAAVAAPGLQGLWAVAALLPIVVGRHALVRRALTGRSPSFRAIGAAEAAAATWLAVGVWLALTG